MSRYSGALVVLGMVLFAVVFFGVLILIARDQMDDEANADDSPEVANGCEFTPLTEPVLVFERHDSSLADATNALPLGDSYAVTRLSEQRVRILLERDADRTGWVDRAAGELSGPCERLPFQDG